MSWSIYRHEGTDGTGPVRSPEQLAAAQEHKIVIDIMPPNNIDGKPLATIEGFMKDAFTYSVKAEYNNILSWSDPDMLAFNVFKDLTQRNTGFYSGYGSKRMFNPGKSYVSLNLKFRAYDDPNVIARCDLLTKCCLPIIARNNVMLQDNPLAIIGALFREGSKIIGEGAAEIAEDVTNVGDVGLNTLKSITDNTTTKMPPHLKVSIGSYFKKAEMVLTSVDFTFSKEFTKSGNNKYPTYVDFDLGVESLYSSLAMYLPEDSANQQIEIFGPGFLVNKYQGSRVVIDQETDIAIRYASTNEAKTVWDAAKKAAGIAQSP